MRRLLLSQSQVSVVVSSGVVVLFTTVLFLAGFILQQRTVGNLQQALKPRLPQAPASLQAAGEATLSELQSRSRLFTVQERLARSRTQPTAARVNWKRLAHVQIARTHHDVCNAIMVLAEFHRLKSPARRVLMFPKDWALEKEGKKGDIADPFLSSSRRLLRLAARRYGVELRPISPIHEMRVASDTEHVYSLASAFGFADFDRLLVLETPGLLLDATPLDAVLAYTESASLAKLQDSDAQDGVDAADLMLLKPSTEADEQLRQTLSSGVTFNDTLLPNVLTEQLLLAVTTDEGTLVRSIDPLHEVERGFNSTDYLSRVSYLRFSDSMLPGPEFDVPWSMKLAARPKNKDADWTYTKLYGMFAQTRMEVCGLDLEPWREP